LAAAVALAAGAGAAFLAGVAAAFGFAVAGAFALEAERAAPRVPASGPLSELSPVAPPAVLAGLRLLPAASREARAAAVFTEPAVGAFLRAAARRALERWGRVRGSLPRTPWSSGAALWDGLASSGALMGTSLLNGESIKQIDIASDISDDALAWEPGGLLSGL
jgi:hypothetical protein